ncbi:MAG: hypothetical protein QOE54_2779 [Streptosporangiaceae bacterium]|jgi:hypothetical protein|nr:hypothetical protein [Streptosporangiaceae bacterium]MDT5187211.1 hypothetical protein [Mycobacterium sp.]MDX6430413.1 hypothetical protein [Streptosporangiaceae bacterium]
MSIDLSVPELAQVLFTTPLQESDDPSPGEIRAAIDSSLGAGCAACVAYVAQEAGDHPEAYVARMVWALNAVAKALTA